MFMDEVAAVLAPSAIGSVDVSLLCTTAPRSQGQSRRVCTLAAFSEPGFSKQAQTQRQKNKTAQKNHVQSGSIILPRCHQPTHSTKSIQKHSKAIKIREQPRTKRPNNFNAQKDSKGIKIIKGFQNHSKSIKIYQNHSKSSNKKS